MKTIQLSEVVAQLQKDKLQAEYKKYWLTLIGFSNGEAFKLLTDEFIAKYPVLDSTFTAGIMSAFRWRDTPQGLAYWNTVHKTAWRLSKENLFSFPTPTVTLDENSYGIAGLTDEEFIRGCLRAIAPTEEVELNHLIGKSDSRKQEYNWGSYLAEVFDWTLLKSDQQLHFWRKTNTALVWFIVSGTDIVEATALSINKHQELIKSLTGGMNKVIANNAKVAEERLRVERIKKNQKNVYGYNSGQKLKEKGAAPPHAALREETRALSDIILAYGYNSAHILQVFPSKADAKLYYLTYIKPKLFPAIPHVALRQEYVEVAKTNPRPWEEFEYQRLDINNKWLACYKEPAWYAGSNYRRIVKPIPALMKVDITINGMPYSFTKPLTALTGQDKLYVARCYNYSNVSCIGWVNPTRPEEGKKIANLLSWGLLHATPQAAFAHSEALVAMNKQMCNH